MNSDKLSKRGNQWLDFSSRVLQHIETYAVPQYNDMPYDECSEWDEQDFTMAIKKYAARQGKNARGPAEDQRDLMKIAHYCAMLYEKRHCPSQ